jgi:rhodanese-related sulfurtransferase
MQELMTFLIDQWILSLSVVVILMMLLNSYIAPLLQGVTAVKPAEAVDLVNRDNAVILDIRSENEYHEGHIVNSTHVPLNYLEKRINELEKHKQQPVIVACQSGNRSRAGGTTLRKHGFEKIYCLAGGITAWKSASLPLKKK